MTPEKQKTLSRRRILQAVAALGLTPLFVSKAAFARQQKVSKKAAHYQSHPHGPESCTKCRWFIPPEGNDKMGKCHTVAGNISPAGWCQYFLPG